jgi:hypothetical protein
VTRDLGLDQRYIGSVDVVAGEVDVDLDHYVNTSEQLPSVLACEVLLDAQGQVARAAGLLCQTFPGGDRDELDALREVLAAGHLTDLLRHDRSCSEIIGFSLGGEDFEDMGGSPLCFRCGCGRERARQIVATLGAEDIEALAEERPQTEVRCEYCGAVYELDSAALRVLAAEIRRGAIMMATKTTQGPGPVRFRVVGIEDGMMLRQLLGKRLKVTPAIAAEIVRAGGAYVGPLRMCVPTVRVTEGERVTVYPKAAQIVAIDPGELRLLYRDERCVIVEKPHGVPAAATRAANRGTLAQALVQRLEAEGVLRPYVGLVHNLPARAAGLALFTIRGQATESFYKMFAELPIRRRYRGAPARGLRRGAGRV